MEESKDMSRLSLVPRPFPVFQCCTLKNWEGPGNEAIQTIAAETEIKV